MKKKILIRIGAGAFVAICFGIFLLSGAGSTYYYSQIDNTKIEQTGSAGGVINFGGSMDYSYTLRCYDEDGNEKDHYLWNIEGIERGRLYSSDGNAHSWSAGMG